MEVLSCSVPDTLMVGTDSSVPFIRAASPVSIHVSCVYFQRTPVSHKVIEKRRRDRINRCLSELGKTVPMALAKQVSGTCLVWYINSDLDHTVSCYHPCSVMFIYNDFNHCVCTSTSTVSFHPYNIMSPTLYDSIIQSLNVQLNSRAIIFYLFFTFTPSQSLIPSIYSTS